MNMSSSLAGSNLELGVWIYACTHTIWQLLGVSWTLRILQRIPTSNINRTVSSSSLCDLVTAKRDVKWTSMSTNQTLKTLHKGRNTGICWMSQSALIVCIIRISSRCLDPVGIMGSSFTKEFSDVGAPWPKTLRLKHPTISTFILW